MDFQRALFVNLFKTAAPIVGGQRGLLADLVLPDDDAKTVLKDYSSIKRRSGFFAG